MPNGITLPVVIRGTEVHISREQVKEWTVFAGNVIDGLTQGGDQFRVHIDQSRWTRFMQGALE